MYGLSPAVTRAKWAVDGSLLIGRTDAGYGNFYVDAAGNTFWRIGTTNKITFNNLGNGFIEGVLGFGASGGIYHGSAGTFASPNTGFRMWQPTGYTVGVWETWSGGTKKVYVGTDMALYAGGGAIKLDEYGLNIYADATPLSWANFRFLYANAPVMEMNGGSSGQNGYGTALTIYAYTTATENNYAQINLQTGGKYGTRANNRALLQIKLRKLSILL